MHDDLLAGWKSSKRCLDPAPERLVHPDEKFIKQENLSAIDAHHLEQNRQEQSLLHAKGQVFHPGEFLI